MAEPLAALAQFYRALNSRDIAIAASYAKRNESSKRPCPTLTAALEAHNLSALNEEEERMPHFVTLVRFTQQGITKIKESPTRLDATKKAAEKAGGKVHAWYLTLGRYDGVLISEFPNDEACANFTLSVGAKGNITTQTLKAFNEAEYRKIISGLS